MHSLLIGLHISDEEFLYETPQPEDDIASTQVRISTRTAWNIYKGTYIGACLEIQSSCMMM